MPHFEDRKLTCAKCGVVCNIKHNQIGGFWWLNGYQSSDGTRHYGGRCPECYDKLKEEEKK